jgi:menaquinol-cytochrome c reductase iron-sulfur subunit
MSSEPTEKEPAEKEAEKEPAEKEPAVEAATSPTRGEPEGATGEDHAAPHGHVEAPPATAHEIARRQLLGRMSVGVGIVCGGAISVPGLGFVVAPIFREEVKEWRSVGKIGDFKIGETTRVVFVDASPLPWAGVTSKTAAWLRRLNEKDFLAFSVNCAHLGCPVHWNPDARLFMCPCHGGVYYEDGRVAAGPPPHPLTRYPVRIDRGEVQILTEPIPLD